MTCEDQGYICTSSQFNITSNWDSNISGHTVGSIIDGTLSGITAVAYEFGLKDWNSVYKGNWCAAKESAMTFVVYPNGYFYPIVGTFGYQWFNEHSSNADVTPIITLNYCKHPSISACKY